MQSQKLEDLEKFTLKTWHPSRTMTRINNPVQRPAIDLRKSFISEQLLNLIASIHSDWMVLMLIS